MKVYLVKEARVKTNKQGMTVSEYRGEYRDYLSDHIFTSKKKAYAYIEQTVNKDWDYLMFPYEIWIKKEPFYSYENIKYYNSIELHKIETY